MSHKMLPMLAFLASSVGLLIGVDGQLGFGLAESLCANPSICLKASENQVLAVPVSAWIWGGFSGMAWISFSWLRQRKGYENAGQSLGLIGAAGAIFLALQFAESDCLTCVVALACTAIASLAGFIKRQKTSNPNRALGALLVGLSIGLLGGGTWAQNKSFQEPWVQTANPGLSGTETVISGRRQAPAKVVLYGDLSDSRVRRGIKNLVSIDPSAAQLILVPLATSTGEGLALGMHCAKKQNRPGNYLRAILASPTQDAVSIAQVAGLQTAAFQTCIKEGSNLNSLKAQLAEAKSKDIALPLTALVSTQEGWYKINEQRLLKPQVDALLKPKTEGP